MHYALAHRTFLYSHYFHTGVRIAVGVSGITWLSYLLSDLPTAMAVAIGALCTTLMDLPSPLRHKFNEMLASVLVCSAVALLVSLCTPVRWLLAAMVVLVSFLASMMVVYGKKAMPLQFAALFIMTLSMESESSARQAFVHSALFFAGGMAYLAYSMAVSWTMRRRTKQQILAEALYELARYTDIKADFYDIRLNLNQQYEQLVRQQMLLADKQQASRDMVLHGIRGEGDNVLLQVHYAMLDLYELVLSTHTDYVLLRAQFADHDVLPALGALVGKAAQDIESIAYATTRKRASHATLSYADEVQACERALVGLPAEPANTPAHEAQAVLRAAYTKICALIEMIGQLHRATQGQTPAIPLAMAPDMTPFLSQQNYRLRTLLASLRWSSPTFRFALRVAMAMSVGLALAELLPYAAHGYWIALTIAVILKPSFSMTRQRRADRLVGTVIGCALTALVVRYVHSPAVLVGLLFLATAAGPAFIYIKYRYTAIAASMQILLLISLTIPNASHSINERLLDTLIGAIIATFFSYVLPNWEYRALPQLIANVLKANSDYIDAGRKLLQEKVKDDFLYRLARKRLMDSLAGLSAALVRMLDEPADKHVAPATINRFLVQNYLVVAHFAAIRLMFQRHQPGLPRQEVDAALDTLCAQLHERLARARAPQAQAESADGCVVEAEESPNAMSRSPWTGWDRWDRRTRLLYLDADQIALSSAAIAQALVAANRS